MSPWKLWKCDPQVQESGRKGVSLDTVDVNQVGSGKGHQSGGCGCVNQVQGLGKVSTWKLDM